MFYIFKKETQTKLESNEPDLIFSKTFALIMPLLPVLFIVFAIKDLIVKETKKQVTLGFEKNNLTLSFELLLAYLFFTMAIELIRIYPKCKRTWIYKKVYEFCLFCTFFLTLSTALFSVINLSFEQKIILSSQTTYSIWFISILCIYLYALTFLTIDKLSSHD